MGEIVNLRRVKKQRGRAEAARHAAENRARHGRTGAEKKADALEAARQRRALDGNRIAPPPEETPGPE